MRRFYMCVYVRVPKTQHSIKISLANDSLRVVISALLHTPWWGRRNYSTGKFFWCDIVTSRGNNMCVLYAAAIFHFSLALSSLLQFRIFASLWGVCDVVVVLSFEISKCHRPPKGATSLLCLRQDGRAEPNKYSCSIFTKTSSQLKYRQDYKLKS